MPLIEIDKKMLTTELIVNIIFFSLVAAIGIFCTLVKNYFKNKNIKVNYEVLDVESAKNCYLPQETEDLINNEITSLESVSENKQLVAWQFTGIGGTGKTTKVQLIGKEKKYKVMKVDLGDFFRSDFSQDYVNDTTLIEKRFEYLLKEARKKNKSQKVIILFDEIDKLMERKTSILDENTPKSYMHSLLTYIHQQFGNNTPDKKFSNVQIIFNTNTQLHSYFSDHDFAAFSRKIHTIKFKTIDGHAFINWCKDRFKIEIKENDVDNANNFIIELRKAIFTAAGRPEGSQYYDTIKDMELSNQYLFKILEGLAECVTTDSIDGIITAMQDKMTDKIQEMTREVNFFKGCINAKIKKSEKKQATKEVVTALKDLQTVVQGISTTLIGMKQGHA
jgi:SpoVK/Ycf46/Vps4 family AAA+-type ATPase